MENYDIIIIGGGIIGMATAMFLSEQTGLKILVIETESEIATHQTGRNSGVIHSGLYYNPGSLKAKNCVKGRDDMYAFCEQYDIPYEKCGKLVVATDNIQMPILEELLRRGKANGLKKLRMLSSKELNEIEPHVSGLAGLFVQETGIVDYVNVARQYAALFQAGGGEIKNNVAFIKAIRSNSELIVSTTRGDFRSKYLINCGGLHCDQIARACGIDPGMKIIPFRGEYFKLRPQSRYLVNNLIYPAPAPEFPFLGVHFTRTIKGDIEAGPNAVLAFQRDGYLKTSFSLKDTIDTLTYPGFRKLVAKYYKNGIEEFYRSIRKSAFVKALKKLIPEIEVQDLKTGAAGVRAQALFLDGRLADDFLIKKTPQVIHVLNAPSPAATASLGIGQTIAELAALNFEIG
jgi:L-2-hydroxyglutarate oxidase